MDPFVLAHQPHPGDFSIVARHPVRRRGGE